MEQQKIYYMYDAITKQFIGEVQAMNQPVNSTELPPVKILNGETYQLENPTFDGKQWTGANKELDALGLLEALTIQVAQLTARMDAQEGGEKENV